ncbi:MAG: ABC transporter ATP-binding protein [SAR324 cluster bacterium]|nr:ABC transporter ATP-binding protein [SAR324 cluster bacterium]
MAGVSVQNLSKNFGSTVALDQVSFEFEDGKFFALLGPSGSGKTTLLRMIAGFEIPDQGSIQIDGKVVDHIPVEKRDIGMVFQSYALFPNMDVNANVGFGLRVRGISPSETKHLVGEALELVRLSGFDDRRPDQLSGGQRQRVALARAIVTKPRVLLLDEPLSALDRTLRLEMEIELKRIQRDVGITTIFVTHDQEEALTMSDQIGILNEGQLVQYGSPVDIYENPQSVFVARFLGEANLLKGQVDGSSVNIEVGGTVQTRSSPTSPQVICSIRPEKISIHEEQDIPPSSSNQIAGQVNEHIFNGTSLTYLVQCGDQVVRVFVQNLSGKLISPNTQVHLSFRPEDTLVFPDA